MPRTYKRKIQPTYTETDLQNALAEINNQGISVATAAAHFHIPVRTIYNKLSNKQVNDRPGGKTILNKDEEQLIVDTIILFQQWQCPVTPAIVIHLAKDYMIELGKPISKTSTLRDWFDGFMKRWENELKIGKTEKLEKVRSTACRPEVIDNWFKHLHGVLTKYNLFNRPEALWNVDEAGFTDDPGRRSVVIKRTTKHATSSQSGTGKSHTTLLICTSVSGVKLPPYFIYKGMRLWDTSIPSNGYPGSLYNCTETGWVEEPVFFDWFVKQFIPSVNNIKRPVILFFDGHKTHISVRIVKTALDHQIELECLPPHSTTILQPLDVVTLHKVKTAWRSLLVEHNIKTNSSPIDKQKFALLISELWKNRLLKGHCSSGFAKAGIYPFDPLAVSKEKLLSPSTSNAIVTATAITESAELSSSGKSATDNTRRRLQRSSSCGHLSSTALNLNNTTLNDKTVNSIVSSISVSLSSSFVATNTTCIVPDTSDVINQTTTSSINMSSGNVSLSENTDPVATVYTETNHQSSYVPVLTDLTNSVSFSSPRILSSQAASTSLLPGPSLSPVMQNLKDCSSSLSLSSMYSAQNTLTANSALSDSSKPMDALVNVLEKYMTSTCAQTSNKKQKRSIERQYGESLTHMDVLMRLKQKEKAKNRKNNTRPRSIPNQSKGTKRPRKSNNSQRFLMDIETLDDNNSIPYSSGLFPPSCNSTNLMNPQMTYVPPTSSTTNFMANPSTIQHAMPTQSDYPTCYRCYSTLNTELIYCLKCNRSCCYQCAQLCFSPTTVMCEYCMIQEALSNNQFN